MALFERCKDCKPPERHVGCHSTCEHYLKDKEISDKRRDDRYKQKTQERLVSEYAHDIMERARRNSLHPSVYGKMRRHKK